MMETWINTLCWMNVNAAMDKCPKPQKSTSKCVINAKAYREGKGDAAPHELAGSRECSVYCISSPYTLANLNSYKTLEAYNPSVMPHDMNDIIIITLKKC